MELSKYIACICEGTAEEVIINMLLDSDKLIFNRNNMIEEEVIRCRGGRNFEERYLRKGFSEQITVLRILDSRSEKFKLSKVYAEKIKVINIITAPEIEMLVILKEKKYSDYKKSNKKPSEFCKSDLKYKNVKSKDFIKNYFSDVNDLVFAISEYKRISKIKQGEYSLFDLLK